MPCSSAAKLGLRRNPGRQTPPANEKIIAGLSGVIFRLIGRRCDQNSIVANPVGS
jgi:hypothetical protein